MILKVKSYSYQIYKLELRKTEFQKKLGLDLKKIQNNKKVILL